MDFSENAYLKLAQRFPDLVSYVVGFFNLTDELNEEDDSLQVGVFQISIGEKSFLIPIISKNNVVQPLDSIVSEEANLFFPSIPSYIRTLLTYPTEGFGKNQKIPGTVSSNPNIYNLVVPPRTGKFVYASATPALELMSLAPPEYKTALVEALKSDENFAAQMHKMIDLSDMAQALATPAPAAASSVKPPEVVVLTEGHGDLSEDEIQSIVQKGYAIRGEPMLPRVAAPVQDFDDMGQYEAINPLQIYNESRVLVLEGGEEVLCVFLKNHPASITAKTPILFSDQDPSNGFVISTKGTIYLTEGKVVSKAQPLPVIDGLTELMTFTSNGPVKDLVPGGMTLILSPDGMAIFTGQISSRNTAQGFTQFSGIDLRTGKPVTISVLSSVHEPRRLSDGSLLLPPNCWAIELTPSCDTFAKSLAVAQEMAQLKFWNQFGQVNVLRSNGVNSYLYGGDYIDSRPLLLQRLIVDEHIAPVVAEELMKSAEEKGVTTFYISKQADISNMASTSSLNESFPQADQSNVFPDGEGAAMGFVNNIKNAVPLQDPEVLGTTIIAELLQAPSLKQYTENYAPDIRLTIDRLGRLLFLSRLKISKMFSGENGLELMTTVNILKGVYTNLGAMYLSLQRLPDDRDTFDSNSSTEE